MRHIVFTGLLAFVLIAPTQARSHGDWGHVHVTRWAIESLPPGPLADFFANPEVVEAALFGAAFPDSGYWVDDPAAREYAEYSHWEPFIQAFVEKIRAEQPPPFTTLEQRKLVAFMMGCAAHGLQDEIFDSLFLFQVDEHDGGGQADADGGTDFFLVDDGILPFDLAEFVPIDVLLPLYADIPQDITEDVVRNGVATQTSVYVNETSGTTIARAFLDENAERLPWTREHYLDEDIPGSLTAEIAPTAAYLKALWGRLHGTGSTDPLVVHSYPDEGRALRTAEPLLADSYVTLIFGQGIDIGTARGTFTDSRGRSVPFNLDGTRWGHPRPRLVRFQPTQRLREGARYTVSLEAGTERIDGTIEARLTRSMFRVSGQPECGASRRLAGGRVGFGHRSVLACPGRGVLARLR